MTLSRLRAPKNRKVLTLKHGRGKVHELNCPWLNGPNVNTAWRDRAYHTVRADQVANHDHCSRC